MEESDLTPRDDSGRVLGILENTGGAGDENRKVQPVHKIMFSKLDHSCLRESRGHIVSTLVSLGELWELELSLIVLFLHASFS